MEQARWRINLFGRLSAERGALKVTHFKTEKAGLLLACLAHESRRRYTREELMEQLWPGEEASQARNNMRVALAFLRQVLEPSPEERGSLLATDRNLVFLREGAYVTDSAEFERQLLLASQQQEEAARVQHLQAAVEQYPAELLRDFDAAWISAERLRLADAYHMALRRLARAHAALGRYDQALEAVQRSVRDDPEREETRRLLMQIFALMGRPQAALRQYRELETILSEARAGGPSRSTRVALAEICRVSGLPNPTETDRPRAPKPAVAVVSPSHRPAFRLPASLTQTIGREAAIVQVADMLDTPETRLVTLTGIGGVGKTRLALSVANRLRKEGRTVCYLPLAAESDANVLLSNLAVALQVPGGPADDLRERLAVTLGDRPLLLVLDNLEHLLPVSAFILRDLLEMAPALTCLATSRHRVAIAGEHEFVVRPLPVPAKDYGPAQAVRCPAVRLWLDRVQAIQPGFEVTAANCADVVTLCRRLEGLPLAIELAAGWGAVLTPGQVARRLSERFDLLVSRDPTVEARHASLKSTLDWSFDRLPKAVQRFLARLAVFPDGWTLEAARDICEEPSALECLALLRERSLVSTDSGSGDAVRYRLLETVREYALTRLEEAEARAAQDRLTAHYLALAEAAEPELRGTASAGWMRTLQQEEENLRAALRFAVARAGAPDTALRLSMALYRYWYIRGFAREGREWLAAGLSLAGDRAHDRPRALMALGNLAYAEGDLAAAEQAYTECKALRAAAGDAAGLAAATASLVNIRRRQGDLPAARLLALESLRIFEKLGDARGQALTLGNLALVSVDLDDYAAAMEYGEQALSQFRLLGDKQNLMIGLVNLSGTALETGRLDRAEAVLRESLELCTELASVINLTYVLSGTAALAQASGATGLCVQLRAAAWRIRERLNVVRPPDVEEGITRELGVARALLGDASYAQEWQRGLRLTDESAALLVRSFLETTSAQNPAD
jgi:predicted ATPase/DNA-binding SARP family transcriptional activator